MSWTGTIVLALVAFGVSLGLNRLMIRLGPRLGLMDQPGERRVHTTAVPRAGGLAIWLSFLGVLAAGMATGWFALGGSLDWRWLGAFTAGSAVLIVCGVLDDRKGLPPLVKLGAHGLAPVVFYLIRPLEIALIPAEWGWWWGLLLFVVWAVALINAFNLIDGLDGLCGGLAMVSVLAMAGLAVVNNRADAAVVLLVMAGALGGFLRYNLNPARIFLGDAGSMLMGFFLATAAAEGVGRKTVVGVILLPIAIAGVPLLDMLLAVWRRWMRRWAAHLGGDGGRRGIFEADKDHLHHRILDGNGSQRKVLVTLQLLALALAAVCLLPLFFGDQMLRVSLVGLLVIGLVGLRHLAWVELVHTGQVVHLAIKLPVRRRRMAMLLFGYDLVMLVGAAWVALLLETNLFAVTREWDGDGGVLFVSVFAMCGMVCLLLSRIHQRLWARAAVRDMLAVHFWIMVCAVATLALMSFSRSALEWSALRMTLSASLLAGMAVGWPRLALEVTRDLAMSARLGTRLGTRARDDAGGYGPLAILGAGDMGCLFLHHLKTSGEHDYPGMRLLGFLDENKSLHGRRLRSYPVLGGLDMVPSLVERKGLKGIVVAIHKPRREMEQQLEDLRMRHGIKLYRWRAGLEHGGSGA